MARQFESFADFCAWLNDKGVFHMDMGLGRMEAALALMRPSPFPSVQVLGTNGKGSICAFLNALATAHGLNCGLYTSPHFLSTGERILLNGERFPEEVWLTAARDLTVALGELAEDLTYFEFLTLLAQVLFRRARVDLAIFEAGLGGAHDATTALPVAAQCYGPIALDHEAILGPGLENIARDKARAMRTGVPVFTAPQYPMALTALKARAAEILAPLESVSPLGDDVPLGLDGIHQRSNAAVALRCWRWLAEKFSWPDTLDSASKGLSETFLPGRMQYIPACAGHGTVILDGAHNCHATQELLTQLKIKPASVIFSALADKNWRPSLAMLRRLRAPIFIVQLPVTDVPRAENAHIIAGECPEAVVVAGEDVMRRALALAPAPTLIVGSLYLLAEFFKLFPNYCDSRMKLPIHDGVNPPCGDCEQSPHTGNR